MKKLKLPPFVDQFIKFKTLLIVIALVSIVMGFLYGYYLFLPWRMNDPGTQVTIERGMTPNDIAQLLENSSIIRSSKRFLISAKFIGVSPKLQAGKYLFEGQQSNFKVLQKLVRGLVITTQITIPEGMRAAKIAVLLKEQLKIDSSHFMAIVTDPSLCTEYGVQASTLEGYLYPDTYQFHLDPTPEEIVERMIRRFWEVFNDSLKERAQEVGLTVHQAVTMASIVEGEAVIDSERTVISALYWNRLKKRMRLQADPTIQYIIRNGPRRLYTKDLAIESPYNTYLHWGLPPGPVTNPGHASIYAVLYPASLDYLYMVANGDGSHTFSKSWSNHLEAKERLDQLRYDIRRQYR